MFLAHRVYFWRFENLRRQGAAEVSPKLRGHPEHLMQTQILKTTQTIMRIKFSDL